METGIGKVGSRSSVGGTRIDGSVTMFWATKAKAIAAAKSIGWPANSAAPVYTRFQMGWSLHWGITKPGHISRAEFVSLGGAP